MGKEIKMKSRISGNNNYNLTTDSEPKKDVTYSKVLENKPVEIVLEPTPEFDIRKCCLVSFADTIHELFKIDQLKREIPKYWKGQAMFFDHYSQIAPNEPHIRHDQDYKLLSVLKAFEKGYTQIIYVEPTAVIQKDLLPLFEFLNENVTIFQATGKTIGEVSNDDNLRTFNLSREDALQLNLLRSDMFGIDLGFDLSKQMFEFFCYASKENKIIGEGVQFDAVLSIISQKVGMAQVRVDEWIASEKNDKCYFTIK